MFLHGLATRFVLCDAKVAEQFLLPLFASRQLPRIRLARLRNLVNLPQKGVGVPPLIAPPGEDDSYKRDVSCLAVIALSLPAAQDRSITRTRRGGLRRARTPRRGLVLVHAEARSRRKVYLSRSRILIIDRPSDSSVAATACRAFLSGCHPSSIIRSGRHASISANNISSSALINSR